MRIAWGVVYLHSLSVTLSSQRIQSQKAIQSLVGLGCLTLILIAFEGTMQTPKCLMNGSQLIPVPLHWFHVVG